MLNSGWLCSNSAEPSAKQTMAVSHAVETTLNKMFAVRNEITNAA